MGRRAFRGDLQRTRGASGVHCMPQRPVSAPAAFTQAPRHSKVPRQGAPLALRGAHLPSMQAAPGPQVVPVQDAPSGGCAPATQRPPAQCAFGPHWTLDRQLAPSAARA